MECLGNHTSESWEAVWRIVSIRPRKASRSALAVCCKTERLSIGLDTVWLRPKSLGRWNWNLDKFMNQALSPAPARILQTRTGAWARTAAVDFFRGLGLWMVFVDHMDPNLWSYLTLWRFGFSDFAEIFVYFSGFIGIGSYQRALNAGDTGAVLKKLGRRVGRLYVAHILSLAISMLVL